MPLCELVYCPFPGYIQGGKVTFFFTLGDFFLDIGRLFLHCGWLFSWYWVTFSSLWATFSSLWATFFFILGDFFFTLGNFLLKPSGHPYLCQDILTKLLLTPDCSPVHRRLLEWGRFKPWLRPNYFLLHSSDWMLVTCMLLAVGWCVCVCQWALVTPLKAMRVGMGFLKKLTELFQWNQTKSQSVWPDLSKFCRWASFWRVYLVFGKIVIMLWQ